MGDLYFRTTIESYLCAARDYAKEGRRDTAHLLLQKAERLAWESGIPMSNGQIESSRVIKSTAEYLVNHAANRIMQYVRD